MNSLSEKGLKNFLKENMDKMHLESTQVEIPEFSNEPYMHIHLIAKYSEFKDYAKSLKERKRSEKPKESDNRFDKLEL